MSLPMLQHPGEFEPFMEWVKGLRPRVILEIGTGPGGLTEAFCEVAEFRVVSVDLPDGSTTGMSYDLCRIRNRELSLRNTNFIGVLGDSHAQNTWEEVKKALSGELCDLLFLDGDHYYKGVEQDFEMYRSFVRRDGWVAFHDINAKTYGAEVEVYKFWEQLHNSSASWLKWSVDSHWGGIGAVQV